MRRLLIILAIVLAAIQPAPLAAESAGSLLKKGSAAEAQLDYVTAYEYYKQAYQKHPTDIKYRVPFERAKFLAGAQLTTQAIKLRDQGKFPEAIAMFERGLTIDGTNIAAMQELERTRQMMQGGTGGAPSDEEKKRGYFRKKLEEAAGPSELNPVDDKPISLRMTEDTKNIYQTLGKLAGINVLFDPDYTSRRISVELNNVSLEEALSIVALQSRTFWRPVTPNTIFVASDNQQKRRELEQSVLKTFYLSNISAQSEIQEVANSIRSLLDVQRVQALPTQGAIVVRATPDQLAVAEKIIGDIDRAKPEVVVEIAIMQVRRDKARNLGITPPASVGVGLQTTVDTASGGDNGGNGDGNGDDGDGDSNSGSNQIRLNRLGNISSRDFVVTIPAATANFLLTDANTKLIQNPQIRALDGTKGTLRIGDRIPVATGSYQAGAVGTVGINPLVQTQFQYIDVGVNIDITPRVHVDGQISLKVVLEVSNVSQRINIGGIEQPIISQRKIEHDIRLKEGEVNLLGGILEEQEIRSLTGIPGLAQIPFFRYFFSSENKQNVDNEIIFALTPRVIRRPDISDFNERAIDVGTGSTAIDLRRRPRHFQNGTKQPEQQNGPAQPQPARPQGVNGAPNGGAFNAPAPVPQPASQEAPPATQNPSASQQTADTSQPNAQSGSNGQAMFRLDLPNPSPRAGATFPVNVTLAGAQNVFSVPLRISFDPNAVQLLNVSNGDFLTRDGQAAVLVQRNEPAGTLTVTSSRPPGAGGVSGTGTVYVLTFAAKQPGDVPIAITMPALRGPAGENLPVTGAAALVRIQ